MKKLITTFLSVLLILSLTTGCTGTKESSLAPDKDISNNNSEKEITIIMSNHNTMNKKNKHLKGKEVELYKKQLYLFIKEFTQETDIKVNLVNVSSNDYDEYLQNRNTQLYLDNGPTLILIGAGESYQNLIDEGVALEVKDKIDNYKEIYESMRDGYYIPMSVAVGTQMLNKKSLERLDIEMPKESWKQKNFDDIMYKYYSEEDTYIVPETVNVIINSKLDDKVLLMNKSEESDVARDEIVNIIEDIRYKLLESGNFKIRADYKYENYHNMIYALSGYDLDRESNDIVAAWQEESHLNPNVKLWRSVNSLNALETHKNKSSYLFVQNNGATILDIEDMIILPSADKDYYSWGFILNRNGKNVEDGLKFLDHLLSDEAQLRVYTEMDDKHYAYRSYSFSYPVVKTIEDKILNLEIEKGVDEHLTNVRNEVIRQIEAGERTRKYGDEREEFLRDNLIKLIVKIVFADEKYISEEIMNELKGFDNEMNLMFSE